MTKTFMYEATPSASILAKAYGIFNFVIQSALVFLFCSGSVTFYGHNLTIAASIKNIFLIFNMDKDAAPNGDNAFFYLRLWSGIILGILYVALLIYIIKQFVTSFMAAKDLVFTKINPSEFNNEVLYLGENCGKIFFASVLFIVATMLVKDFFFLPRITYVILLGVCNFLWTRVTVLLINALVKQHSLIGILIQIAYYLIFAGSLYLLFVHGIKASAFEDVFHEIVRFVYLAKEDFMLDTNFVVRSVFNILFNLIAFCLALMPLILLYSSNGYMNLKNSPSKRYAQVAIGFSVVMLIVQCLYLMKDGIADGIFADLFDQFKHAIPVVCASVAVYLSTFLVVEIQRDSKIQKMSEETALMDANGVLQIKDGVTIITRNLYQDDGRITKILIPASVTKIEANSFAGCGGVEGIYCEAPCKPSTWSDDWNKGCYATIHWGSSLFSKKEPNEGQTEENQNVDIAEEG